MSGTKKPSWEFLAKDESTGYPWGATSRIKVPGGWIYKHQDYYEGGVAISMVFVPDAPRTGAKGNST